VERLYHERVDSGEWLVEEQESWFERQTPSPPRLAAVPLPKAAPHCTIRFSAPDRSRTKRG